MRLIMIPASQNHDILTFNFINQTILFINAPAPKACQVAGQGFWFSNSFVSISADILNQLIDLF